MSRLIVLDDNQIELFIIKKMLTKYKVFEDTIYSTDGKNILKFLEVNKLERNSLPELLFVDLNMPKLSGWHFLDRLKSFYSQLQKPICVYIITSSVDPRDIKRSDNYPFVKSYLIKPLTRETIEAIIQNIH
jgi:CheY-like chemotaxis protein